MNTKSTLIPVAGIFLFTLVMPLCNTYAAEKKVPTNAGDDKNPVTYNHSLASRNNHAVKIYPDALKRQMHVIARDNDGKEIDFFVFDPQGTLIEHYRMQEGDHEKIAGLERGKYLFQVFTGDEETVSGQFEIR